MIRDIIHSVETLLRAGLPGTQFPTTIRDFYLPQNFQTVSGAHPDHYSTGFGGQSDRDVKLTSRLHSVPRLRMSGAMPSRREK